MNKKIVILIALLFANTNTFAQTMGSLDQSANNAQGQYQAMDMGYAGFNSLGMTQAAWLDPLQNLGEGQTKPAYSKYYWHKDLVLPIRLREAMVTIINFPEWEMIESLQFGDSTSFSGEVVGPSSVLLWSKSNVGVDTNVIMFGRSGNKYVFYVKSESVDTERLTNAIIDIEIPDTNTSDSSSSGGSGFLGSGSSTGQKHTRRFQKKDWIKEIPFSPDSLKFDMEVYVPNPDDVVIAPERVWRDDIFTYIDLGEKSLTMVQRPIVTQIVERSEVPIGFRTKGPDNRLIIVEGIGDFVLRNGKRIICLKLRRDDSKGVDQYSSYEDDPKYGQEWDVPPGLPNFLTSSQGGDGAGSQGAGSQGSGFGAGANNQNQDFDAYLDSQLKGVSAGGSQNYPAQNIAAIKNQLGGMQSYSGYSHQNSADSGFNSSFAADGVEGNISIQLGTGDDITKMENLWESLSTKYSDVLGGYDPFFSVDAPADGQGKELFHLRVGPIDNLGKGDNICSQLGRKGVFCSVIRTQ